jgi:hypothetical protein
MKARQSSLALRLMADPFARACLRRWLIDRTTTVKDSAGDIYHPRTGLGGTKEEKS